MNTNSHVWLAIPSKRPPEEAEKVLRLWRERGYRLALWRDEHDPVIDADVSWGSVSKYPGYAVAVNTLVKQIFALDQDAQWIVTGGDDVEPDANHSAEEIAEQCVYHFSYEFMLKTGTPHDIARSMPEATFGVMQPTGDRFADGSIDRICGSPWMGRTFCKRINQGRGPLWSEYTHMFVDEEIQNVAIKHGILWQRRDLTHYHRWCKRTGENTFNHGLPAPAFLREAYSADHWVKFDTLYKRRRAAGFPGSEPLAA